MVRNSSHLSRPIELLEPRQLLAAGDPDPSFGGGAGFVETNHQNVGWHNARAMAQQPDGKIVIAGENGTGGNTDDALIMVRFNPDGSRDFSFGPLGEVRLALNDLDIASIAVAPDGKIVAAGTVHYNLSGPGDPWDWFVARYNANGSPDLTFGGGKGYLTWDSGVHLGESIYAVAVQPDRKIVATGWGGPFAAVTTVRFLENGNLDPSFSGDGVDTPAVSGNGTDLLIDPDGKIVVAVQSENSFVLMRYLPSGVLDSAFGNAAGVQFTSFPSYSYAYTKRVARDAAGNYVVGGEVRKFDSNNRFFAAARLTPSGALDSTFGSNPAPAGTTVVSNLIGFVDGLVIQNDGKIVLGGTKYNFTPNVLDEHFALARLTAGGVPDGGFGTNAVRTYEPPDSYPNFNGGSDLALAADGNIFFCGIVEGYTNYSEFGLYKLVSGDGPLPHPPGWLDGNVFRLTGMALANNAYLTISGTDLLAFLNNFSYLVPLQSVSSIDLKLFAGNDHVEFHNGLPGGLVSLGSGDDVMQIFSGNAAGNLLTILGEEGNDSLELQSGFGLPVSFDGGADFDVLTYHGTSGNDQLTVTDALISGAGDAAYSTIERLWVYAGSGQDTINLNSTQASINYLLMGDDGDDLFLVTSSQPGALSGFASPTGGNGFDELRFNDDANPIDQTYTIDANLIQYSDAGRLLPVEVESMRISGGSGRSTFNVTPGSGTAIYIDGNGPATDPGDSITVNIAAAAGRDFTVPAAGAGRYTFTNRAPVEFQEIERDLTRFGPLIKSVQFNYQTEQSVDVLFSEDAVDLDSSDFVFMNTTTHQTLPASAFTFTRSGAPGLPTTGHWKANSLLADGVYSVTLQNNGVHDAAGNVAIVPPSSFFNVLSGDLNRDKTVSIADFVILASNFGKTNATFADGDLNYDEQITISDFIDLSSRFGQSLSGSAGPIPAAAESEQITASTENETLFAKTPHRPKVKHHHKRARLPALPSSIPWLGRV